MVTEFFEWDDPKAATNEEKHGVSFMNASGVFLDRDARTFDDQDHSAAEVRQLTVGHTLTGQLLVVSHTKRGGRIRIISARRANRAEQRDFYMSQPTDRIFDKPVTEPLDDDLRPHYDFDYSKAVLGKFRSLKGLALGLEADVAEYFRETGAGEMNRILREYMASHPKKKA
ncbi:MAG TPA: BrnT family toxin [Thermoanaerobaculia bacterium]